MVGICLVEATRWKWRRWCGLLVDCCSWVLTLGGACVEICRGWAHWESGVRCVSSEGGNLMAPWEQNGLLPIVNIIQIVSAKSHSAREASHQPASTDSCLIISRTCLPILPSRWVSPCILWGDDAILGNVKEFKDKIKLHCFRGVKSQQSFTPGIWY